MPDKTPLISVVLPTYNRAYCIAKTIDSVLAQTYPHFELLVIDDGSSDGTEDLVKRRFGHDARVRYYYQQNGKVSAARNTGLALAQGDYIAFLDSDDLWEPWKLELQLACFRRCPELGIVWTDMSAVEPSGTVVSQAYLRKMYTAYQWFADGDLFTGKQPLSAIAPSIAETVGAANLYTGEIFSQMVTGNLLHTSTVMLRRELVHEVGTFKIELAGAGEDYEFYLRACRFAPVGLADVPSTIYQVGRPDQITSTCGLRIASHFIETILPILRDERESLTISDQLIRRVLADAYAWHGGELMKWGRRPEARREFLKSLRQQPSIQALYLMAVSLVPQQLDPVLRTGIRYLKRAMEYTTQRSLLLLAAAYDLDLDFVFDFAVDLLEV